MAESVANELVLHAHSSSVPSLKNSSSASVEPPDEPSKNKSKESKNIKPGRASHEEKKVSKTNDEKRSRPRRMREFHNIKISQVCPCFTNVPWHYGRFFINTNWLSRD